MPTLTSGATIPRRDIADALVEFEPSDMSLIGTQVFPIFETGVQQGYYPVIKGTQFLKLPNDLKRNSGGKYTRGAFEYTTDNFFCIERGYEELVDDAEARLVADYFDAEMMAAERAALILALKQENRILTLCQAAANWGNGSAQSVTNEWNDATNATPIADVGLAKRTMWETYGVKPNTLVIGYRTYLALGRADEVVDRIKYTIPAVEKGVLARELLALAFDVEQVLVSDAIYDSAKEGQNLSGSALWNPEYAFVCRVARGRQLRQPSVGRTFLWVDDSPDNVTAEVYRDETVRSDVVRVRQFTDEEIVASIAGKVLDNITDGTIAAP